MGGAAAGRSAGGLLLLDGGTLAIPFETARHLPDGLALRRRLILRLRTGRCRNVAEEVALGPAFRGSLRRLLE